jgi:dUTP pyrophosphatase
VNLSKENFVIRNRERICQMVIAKNAHVEWVSVGNILSTGRGSGGFDNTCKKLL